jgi:hypothetical protein
VSLKGATLSENVAAQEHCCSLAMIFEQTRLTLRVWWLLAAFVYIMMLLGVTSLEYVKQVCIWFMNQVWVYKSVKQEWLSVYVNVNIYVYIVWSSDPVCVFTCSNMYVHTYRHICTYMHNWVTVITNVHHVQPKYHCPNTSMIMYIYISIYKDDKM